jgi:prepilin-type N-terminal cleavage/methylation domain-containing protein
MLLASQGGDMTSTSTSRKRASAQAGFSATELIVVIAVVGILMAASAPFFISYLRTSALKAGAEEFATVLGQGRQLAIRNNTSVCVLTNASVAQYKLGGCGAGSTVWTGPGTDSAGFIRLQNRIRVGPPGQFVIFTYIGTANMALDVPYIITNPQDGSMLTVTVAPSGRISIP